MLQRDTKEWIRAVASHMNLSLSDLALKSGLAASTVTRYANDTTNTATVTQRTIEAIEAYSGVPRNTMPGGRRPGLAEPDALPFELARTDVAEWIGNAIAAIKAGRNGVDAWIMKSWSLDLAGVLPGDVVVMDMNRRARAGDVVCAQVYDYASGSAETVIRRYDPPYLTSHSGKLGPQKPLQVDDDTVAVRGVMVGLMRSRAEA